MTKDVLTQDNEDPFQPLAIAVARLVEDLEEQRPQDESEPEPEKTVEQERERERFVDTRLREIRKFERRYRQGA